MSGAGGGNEDVIREVAAKLEDDRQVDNTEEDAGRHYFSSTLAPLLAGTFGPMANAFSICALVRNWRVYVPDGSTEVNAQDIPDPPWLLAINALSLVCALIGNVALLLNMAKRLRFGVAQPMTIGGFYMASVLLIVDMAALTSSPTLRIDFAAAQPYQNHFLSSAFYYAIWAAALYFIIASLMCMTVYGANKKYFKPSFNLTTSQRTLMLQTMSFFVYLLIGALIWSKIEGWEYLDAVYWANVTLLTIGLGDFVPATPLGKGLLFPFAVGGIVVLGLVVGSIRTLVLERGEEKIAARITEKRRETAINHVNIDHNTIRIGWFAKATFVVDEGMMPAQRRHEEFQVMRSVQLLAERQRRYFALALSSMVVLVLWFVGALVFLRAEGVQELDYLSWLFFSYTSLLTIGYGTPYPESNAGKAFFVFWSLLAIPSLTILISNMGDTVIKTITELTDFVGAITVLPGEHGFKATVVTMLKSISTKVLPTSFVGPGIFGDYPPKTNDDDVGPSKKTYELLDRLSNRVSSKFISPKEFQSGAFSDNVNTSDTLECDIDFYHYVLAREVRDVMKHLKDKPKKQYSWVDWEYYIRLMGNLADDEDGQEQYPGQKIPNALVPQALARHPKQSKAARDRMERKESPVSEVSTPTSPDAPQLHGADEDHLRLIHSTHTWSMPWSWLSDDSPLMSTESEPEWIVSRLSAALERELNRTRRGFRRKPPISYTELRKWVKQHQGKGAKLELEDADPQKSDDQLDANQQSGNDATEQLDEKVRSNMERAAMSTE